MNHDKEEEGKPEEKGEIPRPLEREAVLVPMGKELKEGEEMKCP